MSARPLAFLSPFSYSFSLFISSSCSFSFPNKVVVHKAVRSLVLEIAVIFDYQVLSRHFRIFILSSSLSKISQDQLNGSQCGCESFLHIYHGLSRLHPKKYILLNKSVFSWSLHITCSFMCNFKNISHLLC